MHHHHHHSIKQNCLIKIINIPQGTLKAEVVLAVRHLGYEFYCDYIDGQAMIRFQNSDEQRLAIQKLLNHNNNKLQIEIRGQICDVISTIPEDEEKNYWNYIKFKKNEFRKFFFMKKQQKKQNITQNYNK
uniref:Telomerase associated protein p65 n=1 Tax=Tetrahymena thermophila TaxID=5911 RepID=UPI0002662B0A|nr:Chain A, Telomerase associated protein p65 [Tetrahymena thermophila]4EYT_B Chain B, Telomerase associated protein p65 [Tetrahymena thermophila]4EYT_C Chain C, Telomerase associated protein p65 [Tetrahymena thermophila]4EYT_D Chain D, Telomerase associated protein p65 [Tetrahymena thermophila]4EYT_E Chain E, Telomerase associated protein p65 [Tetrahymena thermophila]4EYT_F Chain F, Telomerase associated protein p65 [Tetrahymena thermophila]